MHREKSAISYLQRTLESRCTASVSLGTSAHKEPEMPYAVTSFIITVTYHALCSRNGQHSNATFCLKPYSTGINLDIANILRNLLTRSIKAALPHIRSLLRCVSGLLSSVLFAVALTSLHSLCWRSTAVCRLVERC